MGYAGRGLGERKRGGAAGRGSAGGTVRKSSSRTAKKAGLPGSIYLNNGRYYWRVVLPGDTKRQAIPLVPRGAGYATRDFGVAVEVAKDILAKAVFKEKHPVTGASGSGSGTEEVIAELVKRYLVHADRYYRRSDGTPTAEPASIRCALNRLVDYCASQPAADLGPLKLKAFREELIQKGRLCRREINRTVKIVRRMYKWAVSEELVPASTLQALQAVEALKRGRTEAREREPVAAVPEGHVYATLPYTTPLVADMIQIQLLTGMRSGELTAMRTCDIETSGRIWHYRVTDEHNKTAHHGHERVVSIGPKAQEILRRYLKHEVTAYLFSPAESERQRLEKQHAERKTPLSCGNRPGTNRKADPKRVIGERYDTDSYRKAVQYAVAAANRARKAEAKKAGGKPDLVPMWSPHQLRHTALTRARREFGLEASSTFGGHKNMNVTEIYAEKNMALADRVAQRLG